MWRIFFIFALALAVIAFACGDDKSTSPSTPTPSPLLTALATQATKQITCEADLPVATLSYGEQVQRNTRIAVDWVSPSHGCAVNGHPFEMIAVPQEPLRVAQGERPVLTFDPAPSSASGYAWQPDFSMATVLVAGTIEVSVDDWLRAPRFDLVLQPAASQELVLDQLSPGDYVLQLDGSWPEGTSSSVFRVLIEAAP